MNPPPRLAVRLAVVTTFLAALLLPAAPAAAHNVLTGADPAPNTILSTAPEAVQLRFLEPLHPNYTTMLVRDSAGDPVPTTQPEVSDHQGEIQFTGSLPTDVYTVAYQVRSADGHLVRGSYAFTVALDGDPLPRVAVPPPTETAEGGNVYGAFIAILASLLLLFALFGVFWLRDRRRPA